MTIIIVNFGASEDSVGVVERGGDTSNVDGIFEVVKVSKVFVRVGCLCGDGEKSLLCNSCAEKTNMLLSEAFNEGDPEAVSGN